MNDHDLERRLGATYRDLTEPAPLPLRMAVAAIPDAEPADASARHVNRFVPMALMATAATVLLVVVFGLLAGRPSGVGTQDDPTPTPLAPSPSEISGASPAPDEVARPWPVRLGLPPGRYFWDMDAGREMYREGLILRMGTFADRPADDGAPVTVAGYPATYLERRNGRGGVLTRTWIVDVGGQRVFIIAEHGLLEPDGAPMTDAQVAEIDEIVASIRHEPDPDGTGYRLTFTLRMPWSAG